MDDNSDWWPYLDSEAIQARKSFLEFDDADAERLATCHDLFSDITDRIINEFYAHLLAHEETAAFIENEDVLLHLKLMQTRYFNALTQGTYDENYARGRLAIGRVHERAGLKPHLYIGAYRKYLQLLYPEIEKLCADSGSTESAAAFLDSLVKVIFFDMELAIDAYIQSSEQRIHKQVEQLAMINKTAVALNAPLSLEEKLAMIMKRGLYIAGGDASCIAFYDCEQELFTHWTTEGLSDEFNDRMKFPPGCLAFEVISRNSYILSVDKPDSRYKLSQLAHDEGIKSFICMPLIHQKTPLGVLYVYNRNSDSFSKEQISLLSTFSYLAAATIANAQLLHETEKLAVTDELTGLYNRRKCNELFEAELKRSTRYKHDLSLLMLDIDHFKKINDKFGHPVGDQAIKLVADTISGKLRNVDISARYGGEEFIIFLPETGIEGAKLVAERLRTEIENLPLMHDSGEPITLTASIGVANYPDCGETAEQLIECSDQALYTAKRYGRNRICTYQDMLRISLEENPEQIATLLNETLNNINSIVSAIETKTLYMRNHSDKVSEYANLFIEKSGLKADEKENLLLSCMLQNVGMITVPDEILNKTEPLSDEEWNIVKSHAENGSRLLSNVRHLEDVISVILHHHERYDGSGYPDGLKGDEIPYLSRVLSVIDTYSALVNPRPYRKSLTTEEAITELRKASGIQLDPEITEIFISMI